MLSLWVLQAGTLQWFFDIRLREKRRRDKSACVWLRRGAGRGEPREGLVDWWVGWGGAAVFKLAALLQGRRDSKNVRLFSGILTYSHVFSLILG